MALSKHANILRNDTAWKCIFVFWKRKFCSGQFLDLLWKHDLRDLNSRLSSFSNIFSVSSILNIIGYRCLLCILYFKKAAKQRENGAILPAESEKFCATLKIINLDLLIQPHLSNERVEDLPLAEGVVQ